MKKLLSILLMAVMLLSFAACGSSGSDSGSDESDREDEIQLAVQAKAAVEIYFDYQDIKNVLVDLSYISDDDANGKCTYTGKVTIYKKDGVKGSADIAGECHVNSNGEDYDCDSLDMGEIHTIS